MAQRPTWKGSLKLSLITIPIRVFPATDASADVSFRQLHRKCQTPIQLKKWCPHCEEEVDPGDIVKGYESAKGQYLLVDEEDIKRARPATTHVIDLTHVYEESNIDPVFIERVYHLTPDAKAAGAAFAVLRDALDGRSAIGHVALHGREYLVAVGPKSNGLVMYTLRTAGEVRDISSLGGLELADVKVKPAEMTLARQILDSLQPVKTLSMFTDRYQEELRAMIDRKGARATVTAGARASSTANLMEALRQSLAHINSGKRKPAKAGARKPARVIAHPSSRKARKAS